MIHGLFSALKILGTLEFLELAGLNDIRRDVNILISSLIFLCSLAIGRR